MQPRLRRRTLLGGALGALMLGPAPRSAVAAGELDVETAAEGFTLIAGAGGNVIVSRTDEGLVLVDSGNANASDALIATLDELPGGGAVHTLFNTHWHLDQVGGNPALGRRGAAIVAHDKTLRHLETAYYLPDEERYVLPLDADGHPSQTFYTDGTVTIGGQRIDYGYLIEAHTDGDSYIYFRNANVLAAGDVVSPARDPALDWFGGGWIGGRVDALGLLLDISDAATLFVPSYGPIVGRTVVETEHALMSTLFERLVEAIRQGMGPEDSLEAGVMEGLPRSFDDPLGFLYAAHKSLWAHHNKLMPDIV